MLRKIVTLVIAFVAVFGLCAPTMAQEGGGIQESIVSFDASAIITSDRTMTVTETIVYSFGTQSRHGIYRTIPDLYTRNGGSYRLRLRVKSVFVDGKKGSYSIASRSPKFTIKIGDADVLISGAHTYQIVYETEQAINFFSDHDELYWNVTGNDWEVPIGSVSMTVKGPDGFDAASSKESCFTGMYGSKETECEAKAAGSEVSFVSKKPFLRGEGMTVVVSFPKGLIKQPTTTDLVMRFIKDNWIVVLPLLVLVFMYRYWSVNGREPKGKGTVVPQYEPPRKLTPMEMSVLETQSNQQRTITATIIDLARRGYLKINYTKKQGLIGSSDSYSFSSLKQADASLLPHETALLEGLFKGGVATQDLDGLKGKFYTSIARANGSVFSTLRQKGFFGRNPITVRAQWSGIAVAVLFFGLFFSVATQRPAIWHISFILSGIVIAIFGWFMPSKTIDGAIALEEVEGFKWFLSVTEKDRLAFHNAPALKPEQFHTFLPCAIAFGVEEQWAKQFEGLSIPEPSYVSGYNHMNPILFAHAMNNFGGDFAKSFTPPSNAGSGHSGFSGGGVGGGFGGGGGGSW